MSAKLDQMTAISDAFDSGDPDRVAAALGDATYIAPAIGLSATGPVMREVSRRWLTAFPDLRTEVTSVTESVNAVATEMTWTGTHSGPFVSVDGREIPASGNVVTHVGALVGHFENGSLTRLIHYYDVLGMFRQMGAA